MDLSALTKEHLALLVVVLVAIDWGIKRLKAAWVGAKEFVTSVLDERLPASIKQTLRNGGGEIIRQIVKEENAAQTLNYQAQTRSIVEDAIRTHEVVEQEKINIALERLRDEITDRVPLKRLARGR